MTKMTSQFSDLKVPLISLATVRLSRFGCTWQMWRARENVLPEAMTESLPSFLNGPCFFFFFYNVATRKRGKKPTSCE